MSAIDRLELDLNGIYAETGVNGLRWQLADTRKWLEQYEKNVEHYKERIINIEKEIEDVEQAILVLMEHRS